MQFGKLTFVLDEDLSNLPDAVPVFGTRGWLEATRRALPFPLNLLRIYKGETLVAYLPLQFIRRGGLLKAFVPILTFYGGPYFVAAQRRHFNEFLRERYEILSGALAWLERTSHYAFLLPEEHDVRPALQRNWICSPRYTVVNLLKCDSSLDLNKDGRHNLSKALKAGLSLGPTDPTDEFQAAYARTFFRKGLAMKWKSCWAADLRRELTGTGLMDHWAVRLPTGQAIAFASVALDRYRKSAIIWCSCSLESADRVGAMHFMIHELILRYRNDYETMDLCGADDRSLSEFKEKFANRLDARFSLEIYRGPAVRAMMKGFEWVNSIRRKR